MSKLLLLLLLTIIYSLLGVRETYRHIPIAEEATDEEQPRLARVFIDNVPKAQQNRFLLDPTKNSDTSFVTNTCSWKCCSMPYPPLGFKVEAGAELGPDSEYVPNNYTCMSQDNNTGCMCMKKNQLKTLVNRGGNRGF